jgi:hypothetical protein
MFGYHAVDVDFLKHSIQSLSYQEVASLVSVQSLNLRSLPYVYHTTNVITAITVLLAHTYCLLLLDTILGPLHPLSRLGAAISTIAR